MQRNHKKFIVENDSLIEIDVADNDPFWFKGFIDDYYLFNKDGNTSEYQSYMHDDADVNRTIYGYDKHKNLTSQKFVSDRVPKGSMRFEYDNDKIRCVIRYDERDSVTDKIYHIRDKYDEAPLNDGHNNIWLYTYDLNGLCREEKSIKPSGKTNFRHVFFYDDKNRKIRMISFDDNNQQNLSMGYNYDSNDKINRVISTSLKKFIRTDIEYDEFQNELLKRITEQDLASNIITESELKYVYEYDSNDNWIKCFCFLDEEPIYLQIRKIVYYK